MKLTFDANNTKVYDNILDQTQFKNLFNFMNFVPMIHKRSRGEWNRVWGFNDGDILMANKYIWPRGKVKDFTYPEDCLTPFFEFAFLLKVALTEADKGFLLLICILL